MRRTTTGSTGKAPLVNPLREARVQHLAEMRFVEILAQNPLCYLYTSPRLRIAEQATTGEHPMSENRRCILEHDEVDGVGADMPACIGEEVESLSPPGSPVETLAEHDREVDVGARSGALPGTRAKEVHGGQLRIGRPGEHERSKAVLEIRRQWPLGEHISIL